MGTLNEATFDLIINENKAKTTFSFQKLLKTKLEGKTTFNADLFKCYLEASKQVLLDLSL